MRKETLESLSAADLDLYARAIGCDVSKAKTKAQKVAAIEKRHERTADVEVLGVTVTIPIKRVYSKQMDELLMEIRKDGNGVYKALETLLGDEQYQTVVDAATDEDGTVDAVAIGFALDRLMRSDELKN